MTIAPLSLVGRAVTVPWGCWDPDTTLELSFPQRFTIQVNGMRDGRQLSAPALANAVRQPLDSRPLRELAAATRTAAIAVDDITRPTPIAEVLPIAFVRARGHLTREHQDTRRARRPSSDGSYRARTESSARRSSTSSTSSNTIRTKI